MDPCQEILQGPGRVICEALSANISQWQCRVNRGRARAERRHYALHLGLLRACLGCGVARGRPVKVTVTQFGDLLVERVDQ